MKIILIPHLPHYATRGYQLAKYLTKKNEVHFILWDMPYPITFKNLWANIKNSLKYKRSKKEKVIIHKIRRLPFFFPIINKWMFKRQIKNIFKDYNIDIIISESYFNEVEPPLNLPFIYDLVDDIEAYAEFYGSKLYKLAFKILQVKKTIKNQVQNSKEVIVVSDILKKNIKSQTNKVYKIPNGVPSYFMNSKINTDKKYSKHSIVYVSNFEKFSNLPKVILAINSLKIKYPDIELVLVGNGIQISSAKELVKDLELSKHVHFLGWLDHKKVIDIVSRCNLALLPFEKNALTDSAFPIKVIEYLALNKKIVSSNLSEIEKLECPNIFIYKDNRSYTNLVRCIKTAFSKNLQQNINKKIAENFTWEKICDDLQKIMEKEI